VGYVPNFPGDTYHYLRGMIGLAVAVPNTPLFPEWLERIPRLWPNDTLYKWSTVPVTLLETNWYDSVGYFAQAIANMSVDDIPMTGANLLAALHGQNGRYSGVSGNWSVCLIRPLTLVCMSRFLMVCIGVM
jgi:hypothetical protein